MKTLFIPYLLTHVLQFDDVSEVDGTEWTDHVLLTVMHVVEEIVSVQARMHEGNHFIGAEDKQI